MTLLHNLLQTLHQDSQTVREQGAYFEELAILYFKNEPYYQELYDQVLTYGQFAREQNLKENDAGIDLAAKTRGTNEFHAIQFSEWKQESATLLNSFASLKFD